MVEERGGPFHKGGSTITRSGARAAGSRPRSTARGFRWPPHPTAGEASDCTQLETSLDISPDITRRAALTDKGYNSRAGRRQAEALQAPRATLREDRRQLWLLPPLRAGWCWSNPSMPPKESLTPMAATHATVPQPSGIPIPGRFAAPRTAKRRPAKGAPSLPARTTVNRVATCPGRISGRQLRTSGSAGLISDENDGGVNVPNSRMAAYGQSLAQHRHDHRGTAPRAPEIATTPNQAALTRIRLDPHPTLIPRYARRPAAPARTALQSAVDKPLPSGPNRPARRKTRGPPARRPGAMLWDRSLTRSLWHYATCTLMLRCIWVLRVPRRGRSLRWCRLRRRMAYAGFYPA